MGREVRRVPPNWEHPKRDRGNGRGLELQPMFDERFSEAAANWLKCFDRIRRGEMTDIERECYPHGVCEWAGDEMPPDPAYYRPWDESEATWFQLWETVSEGTPVSPPFPDEDGLIQYLADNGDYWDQKRCTQDSWTTLWGGKFGVSAWGRERAERFVRGTGWAPSIAVINGQVKQGTEI